MKDERIEQAKHKIRSEISVIIFIGVVISFVIKTLVLDMSLRECITEYVIMIFYPLYQFIRMHTLKISLYNKRGSIESRNSLVRAVVMLLITFALGLYGLMKQPVGIDWQGPLSFFVLFAVLFFALYFLTNKFNQNKAHKYELEFDEDQ